MTGNKNVIAALLQALALEAQLNIQSRHDKTILKFLGIDKNVTKQIWHDGGQTHENIQLLGLRILVLGGTTNYSVGDIVDSGTLAELFGRHMAMEQRLIELELAAIRTAVGAGDETTAEKLRHIEERHEKSCAWYEQQLGLIEMFDSNTGEARYIAEKLKG